MKLVEFKNFEIFEPPIGIWIDPIYINPEHVTSVTSEKHPPIHGGGKSPADDLERTVIRTRDCNCFHVKGSLNDVVSALKL
jgi:hypothetical protein